MMHEPHRKGRITEEDVHGRRTIFHGGQSTQRIRPQKHGLYEDRTAMLRRNEEKRREAEQRKQEEEERSLQPWARKPVRVDLAKARLFAHGQRGARVPVVQQARVMRAGRHTVGRAPAAARSVGSYIHVCII